MKKILQICLLAGLALVAININAQVVTSREILVKYTKATFDKKNIATATGSGIQGKFTAVQMPTEQVEDLKNGFYAGILEISSDYGKLKSGIFNMYFKDSGQGIKLYL